MRTKLCVTWIRYIFVYLHVSYIREFQTSLVHEFYPSVWLSVMLTDVLLIGKRKNRILWNFAKQNLAVMPKSNLDLLLFRPISPFQVVMFFVYNNNKYRFEFRVLSALTGKWVNRIRWNFVRITYPVVPKANFYFYLFLLKVAVFLVCHYQLNPLILPWRFRSVILKSNKKVFLILHSP